MNGNLGYPRRVARRSGGFTLIELMIVAVIIGILVKIAIPAYSNSVLQGHRADAKSALLDLAGRMERYYTINNTYASATGATLGYSSAFPVYIPSNTLAGADYQLSIFSQTATGYVLQATPVNSQTNDGQCWGYQLDNFGQQFNFASAGLATAAVSGCW